MKALTGGDNCLSPDSRILEMIASIIHGSILSGVKFFSMELPQFSIKPPSITIARRNERDKLVGLITLPDIEILRFLKSGYGPSRPQSLQLEKCMDSTGNAFKAARSQWGIDKVLVLSIALSYRKRGAERMANKIGCDVDFWESHVCLNGDRWTLKLRFPENYSPGFKLLDWFINHFQCW